MVIVSGNIYVSTNYNYYKNKSFQNFILFFSG